MIPKSNPTVAKKNHAARLDVIQQNDRKLCTNNIDVIFSNQTSESRKQQSKERKRSCFYICALFGILSCSLLLLQPIEVSAEVFLSSWDSEGSREGQFDNPWGISIDSSNNVYVVDMHNSRVQKFTSDGVFITSWGSETLQYPKNIHVSPNDNVYVVDTGSHSIQVFTPSGELITTWGSPGKGQGSFLGPTGIAVNSAGKAYVVDHTNHRIQVFTSIIDKQKPPIVIPTPPLDTQSPIITVPSGIVIDTENEYGSIVPYDVTTSDNIGVTSGPNCNYSSQSLFPVGTTLVTCKAYDAAGNVGIGSFEIVVDKIPVDYTIQYAVTIAGVTSMSGIVLAYKAGLLTSKAVGMSNASTSYFGFHSDG